MAIMKLTALNGGLKGKMAGTIFQGGTMGQVMRTGVPNASAMGSKNKGSSADLVIPFKDSIGNYATIWKTLTPAQRATWDAARPDYPFKNKFGDLYTPSAFQVFVSINSKLVNSNNAETLTAPAVGVAPNSPAFTVFWLPAMHSFNLAAFVQAAGTTNTLYGTRNISPGQAPKNNMFRALYVLANPEAFPLDFTSAWEDEFGSAPNSGNAWFKLVTTNNLTAQVGNIYNFQLTW